MVLLVVAVLAVGAEAPTYADERLQPGVPTGSDELELALRAGGASDADLPRLKARWEWAMGPTVDLARVMKPEPAARALLQRLHASVLVHYDANAPSLVDALETGRFNCVAASTAFVVAAHAAHLEAGGARTPVHATAWVVIDGQRTGVEATSGDGFGGAPAPSLPDAPTRDADTRVATDLRGLLASNYQSASIRRQALDAVAAVDLAMTGAELARDTPFVQAELLLQAGVAASAAGRPLIALRAYSLAQEESSRAPDLAYAWYSATREPDPEPDAKTFHYPMHVAP